MSLDWNISDCQGYKDGLHKVDGSDGKRLNPVLETLIFSTMSIGIGEITEANVEEFYLRLKLYQLLHGGLLREYTEDGIKDVTITLDMIRPWIGLRTNVFPKEAVTKWRKRIIDRWESDQRAGLKYAEKKEEEKTVR